MANWGGSDIVQGARFAWWIYEYGFTAENSADVRYKNFQNDIFNFSHLLTRLDEALQNAHKRYRERGLRLGERTYDPLAEDFEDERKTIIGNFRLTLDDCNKLLEENKDFQRRHSNVAENLQWHLTQQESRVDDLRRRLHFHAQKIRMVCDRLVINILTDQDARLNDLLGMSEQNLNATNEVMFEVQRFRSTLFGHLAGTGSLDAPAPEDMHTAGSTIERRFEQKWLIDAPPTTHAGIPLPRAFDALLEHFEQSFDGADMTPEKYLDLLKTRWLLVQIKSSRQYQDARPGYYFKRAINQIEQAVLARIRRPGELISYDEDVLLDLPESSFHIWPSSKPAVPARLAQPPSLMMRAGEKKVACINLASDGSTESDSITVFQSADDVFRTVRETTHLSAPGTKIVVEDRIFTNEDRLIPRYALPTLTNPSHEIAVFSRGMETLYRFSSFEHLMSFQSAMIGYDVSYDHTGAIDCKFNSELNFLDCKGHVQLWQEPINLPSAPDSTTPARQDSTCTVNISSHGSHSRHDSMTSSIAATSTINRTSTGYEAEQIKMPAIVIFTQIEDKRRKKDRFAIVFIELGRGIYINPDKCSCCFNYDRCAKLVLTHEKPGVNFPVRAFFSDIEDPNAFDILQFRLPRHPNYPNLLAKKAEFFTLRFGDLEQKKKFHEELNIRIKVRDKQIADQKAFADAFRHRVDRPHGRSPPSPHTQQVATFGTNGVVPRTDSFGSASRASTSTLTPTSTTARPRPADNDDTTLQPSVSTSRAKASSKDAGSSRFKNFLRQM